MHQPAAPLRETGLAAASPVGPVVGSASLATLAFELAAIIAAGALLATLVVRVGAAVGAVWWIVLVVLAAGAAADFVSGLVHWAADTWGRERLPIIGPRVLRPFRVHHLNPEDMLGRSFLDLNGDVALLTLPILIAAWLVPLDSTGGRAAAAFLTAWAAWALPTNQVHQWAHMPAPPLLVRWLQRVRLVLPPDVHRVHHASPYATHYCITTGWSNAWVARVGLFAALERVVTCLTGMVPRADEAVP
ncbi:MAG: fatty acid desaturase CarF family protein [Vicinamibacteraceae bacterium]